MQKISIDPITRLEGHGRIDIFLDDDGNVANAYLVIPELRGFEKFAEGRPTSSNTSTRISTLSTCFSSAASTARTGSVSTPSVLFPKAINSRGRR